MMEIERRLVGTSLSGVKGTHCVIGTISVCNDKNIQEVDYSDANIV